MQFDRPLIQLPIRFCPETLAREVEALPPSAWMPHPQGFVGNDAVPLVSVDGGMNDEFEGPMAATEQLRACPYIMALMAELGGTWGRSRLMGLAPGASVPRHVDVHYYWRTHLQFHIPIFTNPKVSFTCGGETVHMAPGECWTFDSFRVHEVHNQGTEKRVHLVLDTVGGGRLWDMVKAADGGAAPPLAAWTPPPGEQPELHFERVNLPRIMSAWEMRCHMAFLTDHLVPHDALAGSLERIERFIDDWQVTWTRCGDADKGRQHYRPLIANARADLVALGADQVLLRNQVTLVYAMDALVFSKALSQPGGRAAAERPSAIAEPLIP